MMTKLNVLQLLLQCNITPVQETFIIVINAVLLNAFGETCDQFLFWNIYFIVYNLGFFTFTFNQLYPILLNAC